MILSLIPKVRIVDTRMPRDVPERQKYFCRWEVHHFGKLPSLAHQCPRGIHLWYFSPIIGNHFTLLSVVLATVLFLEAVTILSMAWASLTPYDYFSIIAPPHTPPQIVVVDLNLMLGLTNILMHWDILSFYSSLSSVIQGKINPGKLQPL